MLDKKDRSPELAEVVILGITKQGEVFRPSNWWERLSDMLSITGNDRRVTYSSYLLPKIIQNLPSVVLRLSLEKDDPHAFEIVKQFVSIHELAVRSGRNHGDIRNTGFFPTLSLERRSEKTGW